MELTYPLLPFQARQLATHDELAAQLKIAQSNLTLAETHTDYLEETLRRRGSVATTIGRRLSNSSTLHGLGMAMPNSADASNPNANPDTAASKVTAFFRPKLARKNTTGTAARATSVSPAVGAPPGSPEPRTSSSSSDMPEWTQLEARNASLEAANAALRHEREELAKKCAALEKTKDDLLVELEGVTAELFQEANMMVAEERKKVARFEEEAEALRGEVGRLHEELAAIRANPPPNQYNSTETPTLVQTSPRNIRNLTISPPVSPPMQPVPTMSSSAMLRSNSLDPSSAARTPLTVDTNNSLSPPSPSSPQPPASPAESTTSTTRKWFNFGRGGSATSPVPSEAEDGRLEAPLMDREDSVQSNATTSSLASIANSLFGSGADKAAAVAASAPEVEPPATRVDHSQEPSRLEPVNGAAAEPDRQEEITADTEPIPTPPTAVPEGTKPRLSRVRSRSRSPPPKSPSARERPPPVPLLPSSTTTNHHSPSRPTPSSTLQRPLQPRTFSLTHSTTSSGGFPSLPSSPAGASSPTSLPPQLSAKAPLYSSPLPMYSFDGAGSSAGGSASSVPRSATGGARSSPRLVVRMPAPASKVGASPGLGASLSQPATPGLGIPPSPLTSPLTSSRPGSRAGSVKAMDDLDSLMDSIQGMADDFFGGAEGGEGANEDATEELEGEGGREEGAQGAGVESGRSSVRLSEPPSTDTDGEGEEDEDLEGAEVVVGTRVAEGAPRRGSGESGEGAALSYNAE